ncbi:MAG: hypothetical protein SGJ27_24415 [Candidatus Melainabacteria bacterium]|nr:hypothetical protein [Candidatus Melainabacteria bacterium]
MNATSHSAESNSANRPEKGTEKSAVSSSGEISLTGDRPSENLSIIKSLNSQKDTPAEFGQIALVGDTNKSHIFGQSDKSAASAVSGDEKIAGTIDKTKIGNTEFQIKKDAHNKPTEFSDKSGKWTAEKDGETFVLKGGDNDQPRFIRGTPSIDSAGNFTFKNTDFGTIQTHFKDGRSRVEIEGSNGSKYAIEKNSKGVATRLEDDKGAWTSVDGKNWKNGQGETKSGEPSVNAYGEYTFRDQSGKLKTERVESKELAKTKDLQKQITEKYGVEIAAAGTPHDQGKTDQPSARELRALDDILSRSNQMDLKGLQILFGGPGQFKGEGFGAYDANQLELYQNSRIDPGSWLGLKGVGLHELVHHEQEKMNSPEWRGKNPGAEVENLRTALGWKYDQKFGPVLLDKDGGLWSPKLAEGDKEHGPSTNWTWVGGTPPEPGERHTMNGEQMEKRAQVLQASRYNTSPYESHAEAAALLRHNPEALAKKSPEAYKVIRDWDQQKIDRKFGTGVMMRGVDGRIVKDDAENRQRRQEMERKVGA